MRIQLRDYQQGAVNSIYAYFAKHKGNPLIVLPTGSGKAIVLAAFIERAQKEFPHEKFVVLSHVKEILTQNAAKLQALWPEADIGMYCSGLRRRETDSHVTLASIQSVYKRAAELGHISLVLIDECHLVPKSNNGMYARFLNDLRKSNPKLKVIGLSATPYRLDSGLLHKGKGRLFTDIAYEATVEDLVQQGYLSSLRSQEAALRPDLGDVAIRGKDYVQRDLEQAMDVDWRVEAAVKEAISLCENRKKWLFFCCGIQHAQHVCRVLQSNGVPSACVTGDTSNKDRDVILQEFKDGKLQAITNVNVLTTGFDAPDIDAIILLRPTMSTGLYCQMVGRGMRIHPNKEDTLVLDFADNILQHGPIEHLHVQQQLNRPKERKKKKFTKTRAYNPKHHVVPTSQQYLDDYDGMAELVEVDQVNYRAHKKTGKPHSLRVDYRCGLVTFSEWVCFEHRGYPRCKAEQWWRERMDKQEDVIPNKVSDILAKAPALMQPRYIVVDRSERYPRVVECRDFRPPLASRGRTHRNSVRDGVQP